MGLLNQFFSNTNSNICSFQHPTIEEVMDFIRKDVRVPKSQYREEKTVENIIARQLRDKYGATNVHQQYSVGGFLGLKCDIDLFDSKCCGIELKLAKQLTEGSASAKERLIGQAVYYSRRCYNDKLIVLVVGTKTENDTTIKEVKNFLEELGVHFLYKELS